MLGDRKARALMIVVEKMIALHRKGDTFLGEDAFKLFELAKRIHYAGTEEEFRAAVAELACSPGIFEPAEAIKGVRVVKTITV
jgi:hypothetical protein